MNGRLLLYSAAVALGGAALLLAAPKRAQAITGAEPLALDAYGEPEPVLDWFDWQSWGHYYDEIEGAIVTTETAAAGGLTLQYFQPAEFGEWWAQMDADLLRKLDHFRALWGRPVMISPAAGALGRHAGDSGSYHNIDRWGAVRAVDVFPEGLTRDNAATAVALAERAGMGGIGVYTDTRPAMMMHFDNRTGAGRWSRIAGQYRGITDAYA